MNVVFLLLGRSEQDISEEEKTILKQELGFKGDPTFIAYHPSGAQDHYETMKEWRARCDRANYTSSSLQVHVLFPEDWSVSTDFRPLGESLSLIMHKRFLRENGKLTIAQIPWEELLTCPELCS